MKKNFQYYLGYVLTIIVGVILTPIYAICIATIRTFLFFVELINDIFTFMPKALFEYEKAFLKRYWEDEMKRINEKIKKN
jgi:hypothetical protein|tara:strand:+ start:201 stop:440 length:240 start_codon:yes stop_codon:yes gene_type:complete